MTIPTIHRVLLLRKFGGPVGFTWVERPIPQPGVGEVLVKVLAASVQYTDVIVRKGLYPGLGDEPPLVLGYDLVGEVVQVGPAVHGVSLGQRVAALTTTGSYAQYRTLRADQVVPVDAALDAGQVTTLVVSWVTAYQLLHREAQVRKGQKLLVIGAAGAVGQALVVLGQLAGCVVWGASHARHAAFVRRLGATHVDSDLSDFAKVLPSGFDVVFDGIGEDGFSRAWLAVKQTGQLSAYGFAAGVRRGVPIAMLGFWRAKLWWWNRFSAGRRATFMSITALRKAHPEWFREDLLTLIGMLGRGEIRPRVAERIGLGAVAGAHLRLERGGLEGKIVLIPNQPTLVTAGP
jgi:NADPH:quinone reductase-like Zn-dependent oxidoreductase